MRREDFYCMCALIGFAMAILAGCAGSKIQGGQSSHQTGGFTIAYTLPGGGQVVLKDTRETVATTQPSITVTGDKTKVSGASTDDFGGFNISTEQFKKSPTAWGLIGILIIVGVFFYAIGNYPGVILCGAGVTLAFIYPAALVWTALLAVGWVLWSHRTALVQLVKGNQKAIEVLPDGAATTLKTELQKEQSPALQGVVAAVKARL